MDRKVNFHPDVRASDKGLAIAIIASDAPDSATAINFENGMTEAAMHERISNAFRTLAAGIAADKAA